MLATEFKYLIITMAINKVLRQQHNFFSVFHSNRCKHCSYTKWRAGDIYWWNDREVLLALLSALSWLLQDGKAYPVILSPECLCYSTSCTCLAFSQVLYRNASSIKKKLIQSHFSNGHLVVI